MVAKGQKYVSKTKYILYQPEATKTNLIQGKRSVRKYTPFAIIEITSGTKEISECT